MTKAHGPRIFTVPAGSHFLDELARSVLDGSLLGTAAPDLLDLPDITLLLPTRRAARAVQSAFLKASGRTALLMPAIRPITEGDEDHNLISVLATGADPAAELELPPPIAALDRILVLMHLIKRWHDARSKNDGTETVIPRITPAQAANLAAELAKLMDDVERENVSLAGIKDLVPDSYARHWAETVDFLKVVTDVWPAFISAASMMSPAAHGNAVLEAEARRIASLPPGAPVIVAGVTGSIPATITLMRAVAARTRGAIVLPALDQSLDEASWQRIASRAPSQTEAAAPGHPEHPQFGLHKLLSELGIARSAVAELPGCAITTASRARNAFVSETLRPADTTGRWQDYLGSVDRETLRDALAGLSLIEAPSAHDEAEVVALILREAVETPGRTAALVSPDRLLARRVTARLLTWGIRVDDSAGRPFAKTVPGTLLALLLDAVVSDFAPAPTMALLKHPLTRVGLKAFDVRRYARALEITAFRTTYLGRGLNGIAAALAKSDQDRLDPGERLHRAARRLWDEDRDGAAKLVAALQTALAPLVDAYATIGAAKTLQDFARAHAAAAEALCVIPDEDKPSAADANPLWQGESGGHAARFFEAIAAADNADLEISAADYADLYKSLLARENVRERNAVHPRVSIWGPYEARLQQPDVLVLGSLNDGTWPQAAEPGAWLNRPMRMELGLPAPEAEIGRSAHDFASLLGAPTVVMTRAEKVAGVPTVPSRWLMRMTALLRGLKLDDCLKPEKPWLSWARARDLFEPKPRLTAPAPRPPLDARPRKLSATAIEAWLTNPYTIFARHVLTLEPLPELGASPDASLRGLIVHDVLARFTRDFPDHLPDDTERELRKIAAEVLRTYTGNTRIAALWLPRLTRFLNWFADTEPGRREGMKRVVAETAGSLVLAAPAGPFTLTARADRIDDDAERLVLTDYKTGSGPSNAEMQDGRKPQLPLEAAIALGESGFPELTGRTVAALRVISATGGDDPGKMTEYSKDIAGLAARTRSGLESLIATFDSVETPYAAVRRPQYRYDYDTYAHLARVAEWSAHSEEDAS